MWCYQVLPVVFFVHAVLKGLCADIKYFLFVLFLRDYVLLLSSSSCVLCAVLKGLGPVIKYFLFVGVDNS